MLAGATAGSCQTKRRRGKQPPAPVAPAPVRPQLVCRLVTGMGFGTMPVYTAEFYRPGKLVYKGWRNTKLKGRYGYVLPDVLVKTLLTEAKKAKLMQLPTQPMAPPDAPVDTLFLYVDGKQKTITYTTINCDPALKEYQASLKANIQAILEEQEPAEVPGDTAKMR